MRKPRRDDYEDLTDDELEMLLDNLADQQADIAECKMADREFFDNQKGGYADYVYDPIKQYSRGNE